MPTPRKRPSTPFAFTPPTQNAPNLKHSLVPQLLLLRSSLTSINTSLTTSHTTLSSLATTRAPYIAREDELYDQYILAQARILEMDDREPSRGRRGWMAAMAEWENEMQDAEERFRDVGGELGKVERKNRRFGREEDRVKEEMRRLENERERAVREIGEVEGLLGIRGEDGQGAESERTGARETGKRKAVEVEVDEESDGDLDGDGDGDSDLDYVEVRPVKRPVKRLKKDDVPSRLKATAVR